MSEHRPFPTSVSDRLEWLRNYFGKSQKEFADSLNVMPTTYNNWLRGRQELSLHGARLIKKRYQISLDFLFFGEIDSLPEEIKSAWVARPDSSNWKPPGFLEFQ